MMNRHKPTSCKVPKSLMKATFPLSVIDPFICQQFLSHDGPHRGKSMEDHRATRTIFDIV